jgi:hypothetical protein
VIASGALAIIGTTLTDHVTAATPATDGVEQGSTVKTRRAACSCGKLTLTYEGPDPERRSLCHCKNCQLRTGSAFSIQARLPRRLVKVTGKSTKWAFPSGTKPVTYRSCDSEGVTYHFCPSCGSTVFWEMAVDPTVFGVAAGSFTDPTFPPPMISGFEEYRFPWAMNPSALPMPGGHHE